MSPGTDKQNGRSPYAATLPALPVLALILGFVWDMARNDTRSAQPGGEPAMMAVEHPAAKEPFRQAAPMRPPKQVAEKSIQIPASGAEESAEPQRQHPHPVTDAHQRIYRENGIYASLMGAMNVRDVPGLRALIEEYRIDYPEDAYRLQEGYSLIADCIEKLTQERQDNAREYWMTKRGSPVRRFIRRHCLQRTVVDG